MKDAQLDKMTSKELRELHARIVVAIDERQDREKQELKERMTQLAAEAGFSLGELVNGTKRTGKSKSGAVVKYRHPDDASLTWSGRGRKPNWLSKANGNIERFRVG